ncbi:MAG: hypothetical protein IH614_17030 [Desulfuromonadales bacterium]|nr:hypothetical protein [Desulfuromonadales bacterium]
MGAELQEAERVIGADRRLEGFAVRRQGDELHLEREGESFARLLPVAAGKWRLEIFRKTEEWEIVDLTGTLEECLTQLAEDPRFQFWEG